MPRAIVGVVAGLTAWIVIATIGNLGLRMAWPGYSEVEAAMRFNDAMMVARLFLGALSSLGAGFVVAWITHRNGRAVWILAALLLIVFVPTHYGLWEKFPVWYHAVFLVSLVVVTRLGGMLARLGAHEGNGRVGPPAETGQDGAA
jgi:hypothetical protein